MTIKDGTDLTVIEYRYNSENYRVAEIINRVETRFLVDTNGRLGQVREAYHSDGTLISAYNYDFRQMPSSQLNNGEVNYYHGDNLGNTKTLTNSTGAITGTYAYDAFGRILKDSNTNVNDFLYGGEQFNRKTGLTYLRARYLDVDTGRFISADPYLGELQDPVSRHDYLYARSNPVSFRDPTGNYSLGELNVAQVIQNVLSKIDTPMKVYHAQEFIAKIEAFSTLIWTEKGGVPLFMGIYYTWRRSNSTNI